MRPISVWLGATGALIDYCVVYGRILLISQTVFMLQNVFQNFLIAAEKPSLSLKISVGSRSDQCGVGLFIYCGIFLGIAGAAAATAIGQFVGGITPLCTLRERMTAGCASGQHSFIPAFCLKHVPMVPRS